MAKVKVYALATDGDNGTDCTIFTDERQMYLSLAEEIGEEDEIAEAERLATGEDVEALADYVINLDGPSMFTYCIDQKEIEIG